MSECFQKPETNMTESMVRSRLSIAACSFPIPRHKLRLGSIQVIFWLCLMTCHTAEDNSAKAVIQAAIEAHGGQQNLAKTLTGSYTAKATATIGDIESSITWQETFQLPRRHKTNIKGTVNGKPST